MDSRPPKWLLLLTSLLHVWRCATGQSSYTINTVGLAIQPSSTVQSGTPVTISCKVSVSQDNIPHLNHTFQLKRDDFLVHSWETPQDSVVYELNPARAADSGSYECRVTVKDKNKASSSQKLKVTGLQTPFLYLNKTTPYDGEEFKATCSAPEEKGSLMFQFYQRFSTGESRIIKQPAPTGNSTETTLVLRMVGDSFLFCDYAINLVPGAGRSNYSNETQVVVRGLYISPIMNVLPDLEVFEGVVLEVICKVVNPPKNVEVFLVRDKTILKQAPVSLSHRFTTKDGDSGELVCKAEWGNVQKETYKTITVKELYSKPQLTLEPIDLFEGDRFKLTCSVDVYDPEQIKKETLSFAIYKDNVKISSGETYDTEAGPHKNGNYSCKATADLFTHSIVKGSQTVVVKAKVPVSIPVLSVMGGTLVLGTGFQLLCQSDSGTLPIAYTLHGPNRPFERMVVSKPGDKAIFNSTAIYKNSDLGAFICHATNTPRKAAVVGSGQHLPRSTNIIEPVSIPMLTMLPSVEAVSEGQDLNLYCSVQRGTPPISFTWYTEKKKALASINSGKLGASHTIRNVKGENGGGYYCDCTNAGKATKQSQILKIAVKLAGWKKGLIAVFCILFVLALILAVFLKRGCLRFKRKSNVELSVKSAGTKAERLSLTQAEVNQGANVTPGMIGKSVWSEHVSGSESDNENSLSAPEKQEPQYTEVQTTQAPANRAPVKKGTDTVYSEVRNSKQGVPEQADGQGSVEYAQLNGDGGDHHSDQGNHGDHGVPDDHLDEIDSCVVDNNIGDEGE